MRTTSRTTWRRVAGGGGLLAAGALAGGILAGTLSANAAATDATTTPSGGGSSTSQPAPDPSKPQRPDEQLLTGDTKSGVEAAVLARYPGATIERTETDSDGVYESHVVTTDGQHVIVQVGSDFAVTGTQSGPVGRGGGHRGGGAPGGGAESGGA